MNGIWKDLDSLRILTFFGGNIAKEGKYLLNLKSHHSALLSSVKHLKTVTRLTKYRRMDVYTLFSPMS